MHRSRMSSCVALLAPFLALASSAHAIEISSAGRVRVRNDAQNPPVPDKANKVVGFCAAHSAIAGVGVATMETGKYQDDSTAPATVLATMNAAALVPVTITTPAGAFPAREGIQRKYPLARQFVVRSQSGSVPAASSSIGVGAFRSAATDKRATLGVSASVVPVVPETGTAAGSADDPYTVLGGSYREAPVLDSLRLVVESTNPSARADLTFETSTSLDSSPLWSLKLQVNGDGTRQITFTSAPRLGLNDAVVTSNLTAALDTSNPRDIHLLPQYFTDGYLLFDAPLTSSGAFSYEYGGAASATGDATVTGVGSEGPGVSSLRVENPASGAVAIRWGASVGPVREIDVFDASGRRVRTLMGPFSVVAREDETVWDARSDSGQRVPAGNYFVHVRGNREEVGRVTLLK